MNTTNNTTRVVGYIRIGSVSSDSKAKVIKAKRDIINAWVRQHTNYTLFDTYDDRGIGGHTLDRPALNEALNAVKRCDANFILCPYLSDFSRDTDVINKYDDMLICIKTPTEFNINCSGLNGLGGGQ